MPPKRYDYINIGDNKKIGEEFLSYFIDLCNLKPHHKVLEIGSGFGRMAIPLTSYLNETGSYDGLEIIDDGVNWCKSQFSKRYSNFNFQKLDVFNERYNPKGKILATDITFPFPDNTFDLIYLTSVFTHMYPDAIKNYLSEISRILKPNGKSLITYYVLNNESLDNINEGKGTYSFKHEKDTYRIEDMKDPLYQIAFPETIVKAFYSNNGLLIEKPIHFGKWSGKEDGLSFQDIVIGRK